MLFARPSDELPAAADDRVDAIAVALGVREALEREHADALAEHRAVGALRERPAGAAHRQRRRLREAHERERVVGRVGAARDHEVGVALAEHVSRHRHGGEGARARRVGREVRAAEVEVVRRFAP